MPKVHFQVRCATIPGDRVFVVGSSPVIGGWDTNASKAELLTNAETYPTWCGKVGLDDNSRLEFKFVVVGNGSPRWENSIPNRIVSLTGRGMELKCVFDQKRIEERALRDNGIALLPNQENSPGHGKPEQSLFSPPMRVSGEEGDFAHRIANENANRKSWRNKLDLAHSLLDAGGLNSLDELACLQAYLTWIASGQIKCFEDGGHHRPCAHADTSKRMTALLWQFASRGDAERFIVRRIFPSLPSYADQFTTAVPMTRIRDIAHRGDIPHELKQEIKHTLQNKLHRCADPGDLVTCQKLIERCRHQNCYSGAFMREFEIFYVELKAFFCVAELDERVEKAANANPAMRESVDQLLSAKRGGASPIDQLGALNALRGMVAARAEIDQDLLLLDLELERYAFVLMSQLAGHLQPGREVSAQWWEQVVTALRLSLRQSELSGFGREECAVVAGELESACKDIRNKDAPFLWLRLLASADRALRICFMVTQSLESAYVCVPALGGLLGIDNHAVSVFVEAEVRASLLFQVSKFVQLVSSQSRRSAGLLPWTVISPGTAYGHVLRCNVLSEVWSKQLPKEGAIVLCNDAGGDEELPPLCRGVVVARELPVLSHLALRARQLGAVFACTSEKSVFDALSTGISNGSAARLEVKSGGRVMLDLISESLLAANLGLRNGQDTKAQTSSKPKIAELNATVQKVMPAIELADSPQIAGAKAASSGKLESFADRVGFKAPLGFAIPFGVMVRALSSSAVQEKIDVLQKSLDSNGAVDEIETCALAVRAAVKECRVPADVLDGLAKLLPKETTRVAVRSSANSEDLEGVSGAGLHDSILGVDAKKSVELEKAVQQVWGSMFTTRAVQSRHSAGMPLFRGIAMGVLIQPMVFLEGKTYAFIAFSKNVLENDTGSVYLEVCIGLGETLASASEPGVPYRLVVKKNDPCAVKLLNLANFSYSLRDKLGGPVRERVDYSKERLSCSQEVLEKLGRDVANVAKRVEEEYGQPMDMEGVVLERNGLFEVHLVQARPIVEA